MKRKILSLMLALMMVLMLVPVTAGAEVTEGVTWTLSEDGVLTISGTGVFNDISDEERLTM